MTRNELIELINRQASEHKSQLETYLDLFDQYARLSNEQKELRYRLTNEHNEAQRTMLNRLIRAIDMEKQELNHSLWDASRSVYNLTQKHQNERDNAIEFNEPPY